ncbi:3-beta hydroxysteroid dehydrogenase/isomerase family protein [Methyloversatilis sp. RAC08]|uniref:polysaccharide biosynthesis protein n=1 Tax=Methyloversatilis sp. RAC08 TaxID=1842540 RepID=UPI00083E3CDE|nr:nucleoside-diphosphate sugar epimerase/dehydratase [Methyloversatilis sp. RAC08]AOF82588.1 3-beta hydroxysteroid dehydrogenase/isomerase family protein [Methyloversatilis sp. RAC08]
MTILSRSSVVFLGDAALAAAAWYLSFLLRFNLSIPPEYVPSMLAILPWVVCAQAVVFRLFGLYRSIWRFASLPDLQRLVVTIGAAALLAPLLVWLIKPEGIVPRTIYVLDPILLILLMGGARFAYRAWRDHREFGAAATQGKPVLILGAGESALSLLREIGRSGQWRVVGLLDDNPKKHDRTVYGHKVLGGLDSLARQALDLKVSHAIIAMPSASHEARRKAANACVRAGVKPMTVPSFDDLISGKVAVAAVREVEVEDLLGRDPVKIDAPRLRQLIEGQVVMVTGAGGSIGSELCRQIARFAPSAIVAFERGEFFLYNLVEEFSEVFPQIRIEPVIGDVREEARLTLAMQQFRPVVVFHAAAYKHVPLMEGVNAVEAIRNNVGGTLAAARAAQLCGVPRFVLVSTDKAVNPVNVMGATKRFAEMACQALAARGGATAFSTVRFGNVLGSAGSVIPKFQEQIARGGPVTVTHPDIIRYFMSIPEAAQLVLQAALMGEGGEIFVLDMGEPVRIADLARDMIRLSGASESEVKIQFTGLRAGEKLYEELLASDETTRPTHHPKVRIARARAMDDTLWLGRLERWLSGPLPVEPAALRNELAQWVPEYKPQHDMPQAALPAADAATAGPGADHGTGRT